jgi:hypothetical protein
MANTADETDDGGWDSDGLGYHTPGNDKGGDMEMLEAACDDCGPLRGRPASASAVAARGKPPRQRGILNLGLRGGGPGRPPFWRTPKESSKALGDLKINT